MRVRPPPTTTTMHHHRPPETACLGGVGDVLEVNPVVRWLPGVARLKIVRVVDLAPPAKSPRKNPVTVRTFSPQHRRGLDLRACPSPADGSSRSGAEVPASAALHAAPSRLSQHVTARRITPDKFAGARGQVLGRAEGPKYAPSLPLPAAARGCGLHGTIRDREVRP